LQSSKPVNVFFNHAAIVGLGLIGGSLARDLKEKKLAGKVSAYGRNMERLKAARSMGLIDECHERFEDGSADIDVAVIATPVGIIAEQARAIAPYLRRGAIITDVGSVKGPIVAELAARLPAGISFIGGHPIAGTENSGYEASLSGLFENRACILTPVPDADAGVLERIKGLWEAVGSRVVVMDVATHDKIIAAISHLPHMVAFSLVNALVEMKDFEQNILQYSAGGFRDFTRIAASDPVMWRDIALMNREHLLTTLDFFQRSLGELRDAIQAGNSSRLEELFRQSRDTRRGI
jgi:prephenate dehydrogenase